jgi:amino acid adenylation domain-containing protein
LFTNRKRCKTISTTKMDETSGDMEPFPFSYTQKSIWYDCAQFSWPGSYQLSLRLHCRESIEPSLLTSIVQELARLHPMLSARIDLSGDEMRWRIGRIENVEYYPLIWKDKESQERALRHYIDSPLNLSGSLFVVSLWDAIDAGQILIIKWHHLIADAWSFRIIFDEFLDMLRNSGKPTAPRHIEKASYREYCSRSLLYPESARGLADLTYWKEELEELKPFWSIPVSREPEQAFSGKGHALTFPLRVPHQLPGGSSLFELCLSVYALLLFRLAGQRDLCIAVPILGRTDAADHYTVGHFVNLALIRLDMEETDTFARIVEKVHDKLRLARDHQAYPFLLLAEKLGLPQGQRHRTATDAYCGSIRLPAVPAKYFDAPLIEQGGAAWRLSLEIIQAGSLVQAIIRYPVESWNARDIEFLSLCFSEAFGLALESPQLPLSKYLVKRQPEMDKFRRGFIQSAAPQGIKLPAKHWTDAQRRLFDIWAEVLKSRDFSIDDDFFVLGGHSLMAAQVMSRIRALLKKQVPLGSLFRFRTIRALSEYLESIPEEEAQLAPPRASLPSEPDIRKAPLSFSQSRLWFLSRLEPESPAYNICACLRIKGPLSPRCLSGAFADLQMRHEILRTTFHEFHGEPIQLIHETPLAALERIDCHGEGLVARLALASERAADYASRPYDLGSRALRMALIVLGADEYVLVLGMHHLVADQWSMGIVSRELSAFYMARVSHGKPSLLPLALQYRHYAAWQLQSLESERLIQAGNYWKDRLKGMPVLELPFDRPRPQRKSNRCGVVHSVFSAEELAGISKLALAYRSTPYIVLLTCFAVLLFRYTRLLDLPIGTPTANRDRPEFEGLIGTFVNTLVLRIHIQEEDLFSTLLGRVRELFLESFEHRAYPFEKLVSDLNPARDPSHLPLVQVFFNLINAPLELPFMDGVSVAAFPVEVQGSQFDLSVSVDLSISHQADFLFDQDILETESVQGMSDAWSLILREAIEHPDEKLTAFPLMSKRRRSTVLDGWNRTERLWPREKSVAELLWDSALANSERIAAVFDEESYSYRRLFSMAASLADNLAEKGIGQGDIVAVYLRRGPRLVVSLLAVLASGAAYLPIAPSFPKSRIRFMIENSGARAFISEGELGDGEGIACQDMLRLIVNGLPRASDIGKAVSVPPDAPAYVLYTSGSTGKPKGVVIPNRALANLLLSMAEKPGIGPADRLLSVTPISFDISGLEIYLPLIAGATLVMPSRDKIVDPKEMKEIIESQSISFMQATPATWRMLLESGWEGSIQTILCGGETFSQDLVEPLLRRSGRLWNMYGPTETTIWSTMHRVLEGGHSVPIGKPIANTKAYILDEAMEPLPPGVIGDLYISGIGLALGYINSPRLTEEAFLPHPWIKGERIYKTGDKARYLKDGTLEYIGRSDSQIKLYGHRIELGEIESVLRGIDGIGQALCVFREIAPGETQLAAYLVAKSGSPPPTQTAIEASLSALLPAYMVPRLYAFLDSFPLTPSGKVDKSALPEIKDASREEKAGPADETERAVLAIWKSTMKMPNLGTQDNFFSVGGYSLLAVRLIANITREFGVEISLRSFFSDPTVRGCADILRRLIGKLEPAPRSDGGTAASDIIFPMSAEGSLPTLFIIAGVYADENGMYRHLSSLVHYLGPERPIWCLRPRGLVSTADLYRSVREIAAEYLVQVKSVQPSGPYRLIGECVGGIVAYEMARQLEASGEKTESLILMDTEYPHSSLQRLSSSVTGKALELGHSIRNSVNWMRRNGESGALIWEKIVRHFAKAEPNKERQRFERVEKRYASLSQRYRVRPYSGTVHLLVNEEVQKQLKNLGWPVREGDMKARGKGRLVLEIIRGDHVSRLTTYGKYTSEVINRIVNGASAPT